MLFLESQRRLGRRVKHSCVVAGPCFALYSDEAAWGRWGGLVRIRSASAVGAFGPHHLGGVFLVENLVAVAAFKCLLDHGGLLFRRGGCVSDAPPFARLTLYMEKCGCFFWKMRKAWWEWHWRFGGHGVGYAASDLAGVASACRLRPGGDVGNAWCSKCWLRWRGLAVEMLRAWVRGNVARAACDLVRGSALAAVWRVK